MNESQLKFGVYTALFHGSVLVIFPVVFSLPRWILHVTCKGKCRRSSDTEENYSHEMFIPGTLEGDIIVFTN